MYNKNQTEKNIRRNIENAGFENIVFTAADIKYIKSWYLTPEDKRFLKEDE